ncbi:MAG: serine hydrolase domain-containing protein, partial [Henriciella sp.]
EVSLVSEMGAAASHYNQRPLHLSPGGGLVSTLRDYHKFCLMFLQGGLLNGARILSPKTIEFMRMNHLPDGQTIKQLGDRTFSEVRMDGNGFGLGGSVIVDVAKSMSPGSAGMFSWGGMANTFFWIDPEEELIAIQATQMMPSGNYPIRPQFQQLVYAAIEW